MLACSDSRCPPELLFDQGLGDLFVVRCASLTTADASSQNVITYMALTRP